MVSTYSESRRFVPIESDETVARSRLIASYQLSLASSQAWLSSSIPSLLLVDSVRLALLSVDAAH